MMENDGGSTLDRQYGKVYTRKKKRNEVEVGQLSLNNSRIFAFVVENGDHYGCWFSNILSLVLGYLRRAEVRLSVLAAFLMSEPLSGVYASNGVNSLWGPPVNRSGTCKLYGVSEFIPLFNLDFSAAPYCFIHMHYCMLLVLVNTNGIRDCSKSLRGTKRIGRDRAFEQFQRADSLRITGAGVREVPGYDDRAFEQFERPELYISLDGDERTSIYDMDSEDEKWLKEFNHDQLSLSKDRFELMVGAFEEGRLRRSIKEITVLRQCFDMASEDGVKAVFTYWLEKWKKRSKSRSKLEVFLKRTVKKARAVVPKSSQPKRKAVKREASSSGRGKPPLAVMISVEEARASAARAVETANLKRQQACLLMQKAHLATYKAMMALRIAEAAAFSDIAVDQIFDS